MPVALQHLAISRQEKMAFSAPVGLSWDSTPLPLPQSVQTDGRTDGRSRDYYVTTKISRIDRLPYFLSNGAPLAGFARRLCYDKASMMTSSKDGRPWMQWNTSKQQGFNGVRKVALRGGTCL